MSGSAKQLSEISSGYAAVSLTAAIALVIIVSALFFAYSFILLITCNYTNILHLIKDFPTILKMKEVFPPAAFGFTIGTLNHGV